MIIIYLKIEEKMQNSGLDVYYASKDHVSRVCLRLGCVSTTSAGYWPPVRARNETIPTVVDIYTQV